MLNIHTYGGLICSSYLVIYGVSSILYNHPVVDNSPWFTRTWTRGLEWPGEIDQPLDQAAVVRDNLGLFGEVYPLTFQVDNSGDIAFNVYRAIKNYRIRTNRDKGTVEVTETVRRPSAIFLDLHGAGPIDGSSVFMKIWWFFSEVSWLFIVFSAASGVYLWAARGTSSIRWGGVLGASAGFVILAFLIMR